MLLACRCCAAPHHTRPAPAQLICCSNHVLPLPSQPRYELGSEEDDMEAVRRRQTSLIPRFHVMLVSF